MQKEELKQFKLDSDEKCLIYLYKIILICESYIPRLEFYIENVGTKILNDNDDCIPYEQGILYLDATTRIYCYLLNVFADQQNTSISYKKYRDILLKRNQEGKCAKLDEETNKMLLDLNKMRNFFNHIPESLLVNEYSRILNNKNIKCDKNSLKRVGVLYHKYMSREYFQKAHEDNKAFFIVANKIYEAIISDYELMIGDKIEVVRMSNLKLESHNDMYIKEVAKNVQKINGELPNDWRE